MPDPSLGRTLLRQSALLELPKKEKTQAWLAKQTDKLLPVQHFVDTVTVPQELRPLLRANPELGYEAIFAAVSETIWTLLKNPKNLGSDKVGFFGVLHTWGRDLNRHPTFIGSRSATTGSFQSTIKV